MQFMIITFATSIQVIYIGLSSPFEFKWMNRLELFNEYMVLTCCTFLFVYSDGLLLIKNPGFPEFDEALPDMEAKFQVGWYNIGVMCILVFINLCVMLTAQVKEVY